MSSQGSIASYPRSVYLYDGFCTGMTHSAGMTDSMSVKGHLINGCLLRILEDTCQPKIQSKTSTQCLNYLLCL